MTGNDHHHDVFHRLTIHRVKTLAERYLLLFVKVPVEYRYEPGQYVKMRFATAAGLQVRYYSIANVPNKERIVDFCILLTEDPLSDHLRTLAKGDEIEMSPAYGGFRIKDKMRPVVLIAGGSGISPLRSFFFEMTDELRGPPPQPINLIYGCKDGSGIPGKEEFLEFYQRFPQAGKLFLLAEVNTGGGVENGRVTDYLKTALIPEADYYLCGPKPMLDTVTTELESLGIPRNQIYCDPH